MIDLRSYSSKAVNQLINMNNAFRRLAPTATDEEVIEHLKENYLLTDLQIEFIINNI